MLKTTTSAGQNTSGGSATFTGLIQGAQVWQTARNAFTSFAGSSPTGITSASKVMLGLGSTWKLTPSFSGRVRLTVCGWCSNTTGISGVLLNAAFGTGAAPINGAAAAGTNFNATDINVGDAASIPVPYSFITEATGLTLATAYWFNLLASASAGTTNVRINSVIIEEL